ncbi:MAG: B12-binding domain-containing radical SAM protein [Deltaproteobacteria bacterium HGW-Deltaproteobacteria-21]|nr:MAG: B12-binding domain-containing radical SAM protein [Deltaproteobacteria bacterium HGW-Deltaproteobacteria-21]
MRVLLISANTETIGMPVLPIGLGAVAAATEKAGHDVRTLDLLGVDDPELSIRKTVEEFDPEVTGISVRNIDDQSRANPRFLLSNVKEVVSWCRNLSPAPVVVGGSGYSIFPESALAYLGADMGIQGEGENGFTVLLSRMREGSDLSGVPGLYLPGRGRSGPRQFAKSLDDLPLPEPRLWVSSEDLDEWVPFQTRRGCPMRCSYCSTASIEGDTLRKRDKKLVAESIAKYVETGFTRFHFVDNLFNLPPSYSLDLCRELIQRDLGISWRAIVYPGKLSRELVAAMKKAGCTEVSLGFESGSDRVLRSMHKMFSSSEVRRASDLFRENGIRRMGFLLLGGPDESRETVEESLAFVDSLGLDALRVTIGIRIYPFTSLAETARRENIVDAEDDLLLPRFYLKPGLEDWLRKTVREWAEGRPFFIS